MTKDSKVTKTQNTNACNNAGRRNAMRSFTTILAVLMLSLGFAACSDDDDNNNNNVEVDAGTDAQTDAEPDAEPDAEQPKPACSDGEDNDNDGLTDMDDPGCSSPEDDDEYNQLPACSDGEDNDNDGLTDMDDPGCSSPEDNDEYNQLPACSDGIDNDGDGNVDMDDTGCSSPEDDDESLPEWCEDYPCQCTGGCSQGTVPILGEFTMKEVWVAKTCSPSNPPPGCTCNPQSDPPACFFDIYSENGTVDPCLEMRGTLSFGREPQFGYAKVFRDILAWDSCNNYNLVVDIYDFQDYEDYQFLNPSEFTFNPDGSPLTYEYEYTFYQNQKPRVDMTAKPYSPTDLQVMVLERDGAPGMCSNQLFGQCYRTADCSAGDSYGLYAGCTSQSACDNESGAQSWYRDGVCHTF